MKIVINNCFGGFGLSDTAFERYLDLKGITWYKGQTEFGASNYYTVPEEEFNKIQEEEDKLPVGKDRYARSNAAYLSYYDIERNDPILIQVVEELGDIAFGDYSDLRIVEIPDDVQWKIDEYDGVESIHEVHRVWR